MKRTIKEQREIDRKSQALNLALRTVYIGTCYFPSKCHAYNYYSYLSRKEVDYKIRRKEIFIGEPALKTGQKLTTCDNGLRYQIEEISKYERV